MPSKQSIYRQIKKAENVLQQIDTDLQSDETTRFSNDYHLMHLATDVTKLDLFWRDGQSNRPRRYKTDIMMFLKIMEYFKLNQSTTRISQDRKGLETELKEPMSFISMLTYLKLTRAVAEPYINGEYDDNDNSYSNLLSWARDTIEDDLQKGATTGTYNERAVLATLQAKYKWSIETKLSIDHTYQLSADEATRELMQLMQSAKQAVQSLVIDVDID